MGAGKGNMTRPRGFGLRRPKTEGGEEGREGSSKKGAHRMGRIAEIVFFFGVHGNHYLPDE